MVDDNLPLRAVCQAAGMSGGAFGIVGVPGEALNGDGAGFGHVGGTYGSISGWLGTCEDLKNRTSSSNSST